MKSITTAHISKSTHTSTNTHVNIITEFMYNRITIRTGTRMRRNILSRPMKTKSIDF